MISFLDTNYWNTSTAKVDMSLLNSWDTMIEMEEYMISDDYIEYLEGIEVQGFKDLLIGE